MAVPKSQVSNAQQAYDYFVGSQQAAAAGVCPGAASVYAAYAAKYAAGPGGFNKSEFLSDLAAADSACKSDTAYGQGGSAAATINMSTGGAAPSSSGEGTPVDQVPPDALPTGPGGSSALLLIALGVGAYLLLS